MHSGKKQITPSVAAQLIEHLGNEDLTDREIEVLNRLLSNWSRDIAEKLFITEETVRYTSNTSRNLQQVIARRP